MIFAHMPLSDDGSAAVIVPAFGSSVIVYCASLWLFRLSCTGAICRLGRASLAARLGRRLLCSKSLGFCRHIVASADVAGQAGAITPDLMPGMSGHMRTILPVHCARSARSFGRKHADAG